GALPVMVPDRPDYFTTGARATPGARAAVVSESQGESRTQAVVDQLEPVVVLVAVLVLEEVREMVPDVEFGAAAPAIRQADVGIGVALLQVHGAAFLAEAIDLRQAAARDAEAQQPVLAERMAPAQPGDRNRQLLKIEVLAVLTSLLPVAGERRIE